MKYPANFIICTVLYVFSAVNFLLAQENELKTVTLFKVPKIQICRNLEAVGTAEPFESAVITANATEKVVEIKFEDGQEVSKGDILVILDKSEEESELESYQASLLDRQTSYERGRELVEKKTIPESELLTREAALKQTQANIDQVQVKINDRIIKAPFSGRVGIRQVSLGTLVRPGDVITTLYDNSKLRINFEVPSVFLSDLKIGQSLLINTEAFPDKIFQGTITALNPAIDSLTRTIQVRGILSNDAMLLKPGLFLQLLITTKKSNGLVIPEESISRLGKDAFVYVVRKYQDQLIAKRTKVELGLSKEGFVQVKSGLKEGDRIVHRGVLEGIDDIPVQEVQTTMDVQKPITNLGCKG